MALWGSAMNTILKSLLVAACSAALWACSSLPYSDFDEPTVELVSLKPLSAKGLEARFLVGLRVLNPNSQALSIEGVHYEFFVEDNKLLSGASAQSTVIPAFGEGQLDLEASASMLGSFALARSLMEEPREEGVGYRFKAKLSIKGLPLALRVEREGKIGQGFKLQPSD